MSLYDSLVSELLNLEHRVRGQIQDGTLVSTFADLGAEKDTLYARGRLLPADTRPGWCKRLAFTHTTFLLLDDMQKGTKTSEQTIVRLQSLVRKVDETVAAGPTQNATSASPPGAPTPAAPGPGAASSSATAPPPPLPPVSAPPPAGPGAASSAVTAPVSPLPPPSVPHVHPSAGAASAIRPRPKPQPPVSSAPGSHNAPASPSIDGSSSHMPRNIMESVTLRPLPPGPLSVQRNAALAASSGDRIVVKKPAPATGSSKNTQSLPKGKSAKKGKEPARTKKQADSDDEKDDAKPAAKEMKGKKGKGRMVQPKPETDDDDEQDDDDEEEEEEEEEPPKKKVKREKGAAQKPRRDGEGSEDEKPKKRRRAPTKKTSDTPKAPPIGTGEFFPTPCEQCASKGITKCERARAGANAKGACMLCKHAKSKCSHSMTKEELSALYTVDKKPRRKPSTQPATKDKANARYIDISDGEPSGSTSAAPPPPTAGLSIEELGPRLLAAEEKLARIDYNAARIERMVYWLCGFYRDPSVGSQGAGPSSSTAPAGRAPIPTTNPTIPSASGSTLPEGSPGAGVSSSTVPPGRVPNPATHPAIPSASRSTLPAVASASRAPSASGSLPPNSSAVPATSRPASAAVPSPPIDSAALPAAALTLAAPTNAGQVPATQPVPAPSPPGPMASGLTMPLAPPMSSTTGTSDTAVSCPSAADGQALTKEPSPALPPDVQLQAAPASGGDTHSAQASGEPAQLSPAPIESEPATDPIAATRPSISSPAPGLQTPGLQPEPDAERSNDVPPANVTPPVSPPDALVPDPSGDSQLTTGTLQAIPENAQLELDGNADVPAVGTRASKRKLSNASSTASKRPKQT